MQSILSQCAGAELREFLPGTVMISQGTKTGQIFVLVEGRVVVLRDDTEVRQHARAPANDLGFGVRGFVGQDRQRGLRDVGLHQGVEERGFRTEGPEDRDFVDVRLDGDEARRRAAEAVLRVDALGGLEDSISDFHGA